MLKIYGVRLEVSERRSLEAILRKQKCAAHRQRHARILLKADENSPKGSLTDAEVAEVAEVERARWQCEAGRQQQGGGQGGEVFHRVHAPLIHGHRVVAAVVIVAAAVAAANEVTQQRTAARFPRCFGC